MSPTILQINDVTLALLMTLLDGVKGPCWIVVEITTPVRQDSQSPCLQFSSNHETLPSLKVAVEAVAITLDEPRFCFTLDRIPVESDDSALKTTLIQAPHIDPEKWKVMSKREKQKVLMREIFIQTPCTVMGLHRITGVSHTHISNINQGKRSLSFNFANKLISTLPLSDPFITMIWESVGE